MFQSHFAGIEISVVVFLLLTIAYTRCIRGINGYLYISVQKTNVFKWTSNVCFVALG